MGKLSQDQKGSHALGLILAIIVVGLIGGVGYMVYKNQNNQKDNNNSSNQPAVVEEEQDSLTEADIEDAFVNVVLSDGAMIQKSPKQIAKTDDQAAVLRGMRASCDGENKYVTVNVIVFDGNSNYVQDRGYARINASSCVPIVTSLEDGASGASHYLSKQDDGTWKLDVVTQMTPPCSKVDYLGYPASIIPRCTVDASSERAPKL